MNVLAIVLMLVFIAVAVLLLIPFHLKLEAQKERSSIKGVYKISWAGLILRQGEMPTGETIAGAPVERLDEVPEVEEAEPSEPGSPNDRSFSMPADPKLFFEAMPHIIHMVQGLIRSVSLNKFCCNLVMGLEDPADTAVAFGLIWSIVSAVGVSRTGSISMEPHFGGERLDGSVAADLRVRLISIIVVSIKSLESKPIRKLLWSTIMGG